MYRPYIVIMGLNIFVNFESGRAGEGCRRGEGLIRFDNKSVAGFELHSTPCHAFMLIRNLDMQCRKFTFRLLSSPFFSLTGLQSLLKVVIDSFRFHRLFYRQVQFVVLCFVPNMKILLKLITDSRLRKRLPGKRCEASYR